ncbi:uncharacterized protein [Choristoneura fumiferana]|uniref:uncharacterized protein n=1 Tax=Choristoneura fumiferana TaxID=7141 RepID=UPI003D1547A7
MSLLSNKISEFLEDKLITDRMTELWTNFVKYGNPTPTVTQLVPVHWPTVTRDRWHYVELDTMLRVSSRPYFMTAWRFLISFIRRRNATKKATNSQRRIQHQR